MAEEHQKVATEEQIVSGEAEKSEPVSGAEADEKVEVETSEQAAAPSAEEQRIAELEAELIKAQETIAGQKDSVVRAAAEVDNIRRRAAQDVEKARKFALEKFANELLPVIDNLERALDVANKDEPAIKPMLEGVELTLKSLTAAVAKFGIEPVDPTGEDFDPAKHQAMQMLPSEEFAVNKVISVMQKGYLLNDRLLRPAMVIVSKGLDQPKVDTSA